MIEPDDLKAIAETVRSALVEALQDEDIRAQMDRRSLPAAAPRPELHAEFRTLLTFTIHAPDGPPIERPHATEAEARAVADAINAGGRNTCEVQRRFVTPWEPADRGHRPGQRRD